MVPSIRRSAVLFAVATGSLLLFGPLTFYVLVTAALDLAGGGGLEPPYGWPGLAFFVVAALWSFTTAGEIAMIRVHGFDTLHRGTSRLRVLGRHAALVGPLVAGVVVFGPPVLGTLRALGVAGMQSGDGLVLGLGLALLAAIVGVSLRTISAFRQGLARGR